MTIRVRFAPSPTGNLHIGGLRAALFNYYFTKKNNGTFMIRIEDTDHARNQDEYIKAILDACLWCNLKSDEEILYQSKRVDVYKKYIQILLDSGFAYYSDELDEFGNQSRVIKCKIDKSVSYIKFQDIIRGEISFPINEFDDFIIVRSDGTPLYNLVVVIDDIEMNISHIIRGEEHLSNTPKQLFLYKALKKNPPQFAHLPLILGEDRKKLSKRDAATSVMDYKNAGYLSEALCMYLLRLGWAYKDQEFFTKEEILCYFRLEDVNLSGAIFDIKKLMSINQYYIKKLSVDELYNEIVTWNKDILNINDREIDKKLIFLFQSRSQTLLKLIENINSVKNRPAYFIDDNYDYYGIKNNLLLLKQVLIKNNTIEFSLLLKNDIFKLIDKKMLYQSLRYAILGVFESLSIIEIMNILQRDEILFRLNQAINFLESYKM